MEPSDRLNADFHGGEMPHTKGQTPSYSAGRTNQECEDLPLPAGLPRDPKPYRIAKALATLGAADSRGFRQPAAGDEGGTPSHRIAGRPRKRLKRLTLPATELFRATEHPPRLLLNTIRKTGLHCVYVRN